MLLKEIELKSGHLILRFEACERSTCQTSVSSLIRSLIFTFLLLHSIHASRPVKSDNAWHVPTLDNANTGNDPWLLTTQYHDLTVSVFLSSGHLPDSNVISTPIGTELYNRVKKNSEMEEESLGNHRRI